jgi:hypothetical protein
LSDSKTAPDITVSAIKQVVVLVEEEEEEEETDEDLEEKEERRRRDRGKISRKKEKRPRINALLFLLFSVCLSFPWPLFPSSSSVPLS